MSAPVEPRTELGAWLRAARLERGWTQVEACARLTEAFGRTVAQSELSKWEAGKVPPQPATLRILEQVLQSKSPA
jgi:transcriptional regulator with XRE-family HTH domain